MPQGIFEEVKLSIKNIPPYDDGFIPFYKFMTFVQKSAKEKMAIALIAKDENVFVYETKVTGTNEAVDKLYIERLIKFLLWAKGGYEIIIYGNESLANYIKSLYCHGGKRAFDVEMMEKIYSKSFSVKADKLENLPKSNFKTKKIDKGLNGCRIGFDAGGSDRKVSAVIDGEVVYSEQVAWSPKLHSDPSYHYSEIREAFKTAAQKMPRVDAIGISSAGIFINNQAVVASLFKEIPPELYEQKIKNIYIEIANEIAPVPLIVANDGDVSALAGAISLNDSSILGIAMGTSQAGGYIDEEGNITPYLNELAFTPVDLNPKAEVDEWSMDYGCGVKYFSQDGVIRLAKEAGMNFPESALQGEKFKLISELMEKNNPLTVKIFEAIGIYLGHTIPLYYEFYRMRNVLLLGGVMSDSNGSVIIKAAQKVLDEEYPNVAKIVALHSVDGSNCSIGQAIAAASMPKVI